MPDDPFAIFELDRRFTIDEPALRQRFLKLSAEMHPDRFPDPIEQADAVEKMSLITDAYRVLGDPESRARLLLDLSAQNDASDRDALPPDLLMDVMDVREEMESAIDSGNADELDRLRTWASDRREQHLQQLAGLLDGEINSTVAAKARLELNALRYMQRMLEQMPD